MNVGANETKTLVVESGPFLLLVHLQRFDPRAENRLSVYPTLRVDVAVFLARSVVVADGFAGVDIRHNARPSLDPIAYCLASSCWQVVEMGSSGTA